MAQAAGADLWHMWHFQAPTASATRPAYPYGLRVKKVPDWTPGVKEPDVRMSWIVLDRQGRRFMNEYQPYLQTPATARSTSMTRRPSASPHPGLPRGRDEEGRKLYPLGQTVLNDRTVEPYEWSGHQSHGSRKRHPERADSVEELRRDRRGLSRPSPTASRGGMPPSQRARTATMPALRFALSGDEPAFYVGELWPVVSNTQGGPAHDAHQRVVNAHGEPIPRLYEAGELARLGLSLSRRRQPRRMLRHRPDRRP